MRLHPAAMLICLGASFNAACNSPTTPSAIPTTTVVPAAATSPTSTPPVGITVAGKVFDTAMRELPGAVVEVVDGPSAGMMTTTDASGLYGLAGSFDENTHFRATSAGHAEAIRPMAPRCATCNPKFWVYFFLPLPVPPADIAGDYTFTVIADGACTALPEHARRRTYSTTVSALTTQPTSANTLFTAQVNGANLVSGLGFESVFFAVAGDYLTLYMGDLHGQPGLLEITAPNAYFSIGGFGEATVGANGASIISSSFEGEIADCELKPGLDPLVNGRYSCTPERAVRRVVCPSNRHQLILTRR